MFERDTRKDFDEFKELIKSDADLPQLQSMSEAKFNPLNEMTFVNLGKKKEPKSVI